MKKGEVKIVKESESLLKAKAELHIDYDAYINGETTLMNFEDFAKEMNTLFETELRFEGINFFKLYKKFPKNQKTLPF